LACRIPLANSFFVGCLEFASLLVEGLRPLRGKRGLLFSFSPLFFGKVPLIHRATSGHDRQHGGRDGAPELPKLPPASGDLGGTAGLNERPLPR
jgi:hypothetical protein